MDMERVKKKGREKRNKEFIIKGKIKEEYVRRRKEETM